MKTAVIYARYSSDKQNEQSIEGQLRVCQDFAKRNDIIILDTYIDRAMTGTNDKRAEFQRMIKDSEKHNFEIVLVYKLDRFSRNKYETAMHKKTLRDNGVKIVSAMENIPDTPEGIILESLLEGMAEYYSAELAQKVRRGRNESRQKGNYVGGGVPYGYKVENKKLVINTEEAEIVKYIYQEYSKGVFVRDIIATLTEKRIFNRGKIFARNTVYNMLKRELYSGIYTLNGQVFDNIYPQIVPQEVYAKVRQKVERNRYGKRSLEVNYLLRNKLICGYCGSSITAECGTCRDGTRKRYYKCIGRKKKNGCKKLMIRKEILENFVLDVIIEELQKPNLMDKIIDTLLKLQTEQQKENSSISALIKDKTQLKTSLNNIMKAIEQGVINKTTNQRMTELESQIEEIETKILIEKTKTEVQISETEMREFYAKALRLEPALLINTLIEQIKVYDDKIEIKFASPLFENPDKSQGFLIYKTIKQIPYIIDNRKKIEYIAFEVEMYV